MLDNLRQIGVFVRAAEHGSFAAAGEALGLTGSAVSKSVAALEATLGVPLLRRSSRGIALTAEGRRYQARCRQVLEALAEAGRDIGDARSRATGRLRVTMHPSAARARIVPALPDFLRRHPQLDVQVVLEIDPSRFVERGFDLCVLLGDPGATWGGSGTTGALAALRLVDSRYLTCAAPSYLAARGLPREPEELLGHDTLVVVAADGRPRLDWHFADERRHCTVTVRPLLAVNDGPALVNAALAGQGVVHMPAINLEPRVSRGLLVPLLPGWYSEAPPVTLLFPAAARQLPRVRVFIAFLQELFRDVGPGTAVPPAGHVPQAWAVRLGVRRAGG